QAWWLALLALVLFRLLDILKPGPIGWLDREVKGGLGVMLDDLVAGAVAGLVCLLAVYFVT
ncbi:MAG: phosphatidylglycerophosphatase A, partial [Pseudomonadota bacterium]